MKSIIVAEKRTGSTFLQNALNSHPNITCYDELFMKNKAKKRHGMKLYNFFKDKWTIEQYLDWVYSLDKNICFRLMYPHYEHWKFDYILKEYKINIIHLVRTNYLKLYLSRLLMKERNKTDRVQIPVGSLVSILNGLNKKDKRFKKRLKNVGKNFIQIDFEKVIGESSGDIKNEKKVGSFNIKSDQITYISREINSKLCEFFKVGPFEMHCNITKKNRKGLKYHIKNYKDVENELKANNMEHFLE